MMTVTDDRIRQLVAARVGTSPDPLTATEIVQRARRSQHAVSPSMPPRRARPIVAMALVAVTAVVVAGGLFLIGRRDTGVSDVPPPPPTPVSGVKVGAYFLPAELPDDFRMLSVHEHAGDLGRIDAATAVYEGADGGRLHVSTGDRGVERPAWRNSAPVPDGTAHWSSPSASPVGRFMEFVIELDAGPVVNGVVVSVDETAVADLLAVVRPGVGVEPPTLDAPGWSLVTAVAAGANPIVAEWTAYWGRPSGYLYADSLEVTVRRYRAAVDVDVRFGAWTVASDVGGRTVYGGQVGLVPTWYPAPDVEVQVEGNGTVRAEQAIASLTEVDEATFAAAVTQIEAGLDEAEVIGQRVEFESGAAAEYVGEVGNPGGVCLTVDVSTRCDLAVTSLAGFTETEDVEMVFFDTELLVDGRWFSTGIRIDRGADAFSPPVPSGAETVVIGDRTYYLVEHPADALVVTGAYDTPTFRPAR